MRKLPLLVAAATVASLGVLIGVLSDHDELPLEKELVPTVTGRVLPFKVLDAVRNRAFQNGMVGAMSAVAVNGGTKQDWAATAAYVARHSIVKDVTFAKVEVFVDSPWGDKPPQWAKRLATAYYGPRPGKTPWNKPFDLTVAEKAGSLPDIEWSELEAVALDRQSKVTDPDRKMQLADAEASTIVIRKYHLPSNWRPAAMGSVGDGAGESIDGRRVQIVETAEGAVSLLQLTGCLNQESDLIITGCAYDGAAYPAPKLGRP